MAVTVDQLLPGTVVRTKRATEMLSPDWHLDHSSGGRFYVNYLLSRVIPTDVLGQQYVVDSTNRATGAFYAYEVGSNSGVLVLLYDTVVAEIISRERSELGGAGSQRDATTCDCGKDKAGRQDIGDHSYWCAIEIARRGGSTDDYEVL